MDIQGQLNQDLKAGMLARDELKVSTLRSLKSALTYASVDDKAKGGDGSLSDEQVQSVLTKESKKRQDSADAFNQGGASDRAEKELAEKAIIANYLPEPIGDEELASLVAETIAELGASGPQDMGKVIGAVKSKASGSVDGARLAQVVKKRLNS